MVGLNYLITTEGLTRLSIRSDSFMGSSFMDDYLDGTLLKSRSPRELELVPDRDWFEVDYGLSAEYIQII